MTNTKDLPTRQFRCRLEELGPIAQLLFARYKKHRVDFMAASTDFGAAFETAFEARVAELEALVPTRQRLLTSKEETRRMVAAAKALRHPLNLLDIQVGAAGQAKTLTVAVKDMGLGRVRAAIQNRDMEALDEALGHLIKLVEANQAALEAKGLQAATLAALRAARQDLGQQNTDQDDGRLEQVELTEANVTAGNALWALVAEIMRVGRLLYRETDPTRAKGYTLPRIKKLMRSANEGGAGADDEQPT